MQVPERIIAATREPMQRSESEVVLTNEDLPIAYLAGTFPVSTETFVYKEVQELRRRGWLISTIGLHESRARLPGTLESMARDTWVVYNSPVARTMAIVGEFLTHPIRASRTVGWALLDVLVPGERTTAYGRCKVLLQALMGIALAAHLRTLGIRHVHCHFAHAPTTVGMYATKQIQGTFSFTGHANDLFVRRSLLKRKLQRAAFVSCISEYHRRLYSDISGLGLDRLPIIRCGIDFEDVPSQASTRAHTTNQPLQILTVARLVPKKGIDLLLHSMHSLARAGIQTQLKIAGEGPRRGELEGLMRDLGLEGDVEFLGAVDHQAITTLLTKAHVFALPCRIDSDGDRDGIPVAAMEAMAAGLPVVIGDLPAIRELVTNNLDGILTEQGDVQSLTDALRSLAQDSTRRFSLGQEARQRVLREFSLRDNVSKLESALRRAQSGEPI
jgi:glycosyltransferase involved in cell wall biosynthesis